MRRRITMFAGLCATFGVALWALAAGQRLLPGSNQPGTPNALLTAQDPAVAQADGITATDYTAVFSLKQPLRDATVSYIADDGTEHKVKVEKNGTFEIQSVSGKLTVIVDGGAVGTGLFEFALTRPHSKIQLRHDGGQFESIISPGDSPASALHANGNAGVRQAFGGAGCGDGICGDGCGDCDMPNAGGLPGCSDPDCESLVCASDPFCCDVAWDGICADEAATMCDCAVEDCASCEADCGPCAGGCGDGACEPSACGDCNMADPDGLPGCSDPVCESIVCGLDPFCCDVAWDGICAGEAEENCDCAGEDCMNCPADCGACPGCDCPAEANDENEACGDDTNGGCNSTPAAFTDATCGDTWCGNSWADGGNRDTDWYLVSTGGGPISATLTSAFPGVAFIVDGIAACAPAVVGAIGCSDGCAPIADAAADLPAGSYVVFVAPGDCAGGGVFDGLPCGGSNEYVLSISCTPGGEPVCGNGVVEPGEECDDGNTDPGDGCDENCQFEQPPSNCCTEGGNGGIGCDCPPCEALICGIDPFCCDVAWDGICADEAQDLCDVCQTNVCEAAVCGDGMVQPPETCDDGNTDPGDGCDENCMIEVTNDDCADAIAIEVPSLTAGTTDGANVDTVPGDFCGTSVNSPGVWYSVIGTGNTMTATTCTNFFDYDTKLSVFCQGCGTLNCIDGNDDNCPDGASGLLSTVSWCSQAGAEYLILVHGFGGQSGLFELDVSDDGVGCVGGVQCLPEGACCVDCECAATTTEDECTGLGGDFYEGETCTAAVTGYTVEACANSYFDISGTGTVVPEASNNDDGGEVVGIGFTFNFFGDDHTDVGVSSNGYLTFGPDLTDFSNDPIPSNTDPNDAIFPYWDDWNPSSSGTVYVEQFAAPQRTMFQWDDVVHFGGGGNANFQAILFPDGAIEFRYGDPLFLDSPTVGLENQDGTDGVDAGAVGVGDCVRFVPQTAEVFECPQICEIQASLDVKPGGCPNPLNWKSQGYTPIALLGDAVLDVSQVDLSTLQLSRADGVGGSVAPNEGPPGPHSTIDDVGTPFAGNECGCHDLTGDGIDDIMMHFDTPDLVDALQLANLPGGSMIALELNAALLDGTPVVATDCIMIVPSSGNAAFQANAQDAFVEISPTDLFDEAGGIPRFQRWYMPGTMVTITAPEITAAGSEFIRWIVNGEYQPIGQATIEVAVDEWSTVDVLEAVYRHPQLLAPPGPAPGLN